MKHMARRLARSGGLYVSRYPPPETLAFHLKQLTRRLEINCVLDVGAHQGGYARLLRREAGFGGEIVSFEPAALSFAALRPAVEVRRLADVFDEVTAHVPDPEVLLKVDTQGYDLEVIEGAAEVLCRVAA
jgi:hypothetical protein